MGSARLSPGERRRAVFLDRDGVLNAATWTDGVPHPPATPDEVRMLPGVPEALDRLAAAGFLLIVVTNQPDVARGTTTRAEVEAINARVMAGLALHGLEVCYHDNRDGCDCRKPAPGMLLRAARRENIDLARSFMVGDRWRDVEAGLRAGCRAVLVRGEETEAVEVQPWATVGSLAEAADRILRDERRGGGA